MNKKDKPEIWIAHLDKLLNPQSPKKLIKTGNKKLMK
jgi:hypothetical protein